jgi:glycosyltransferase involved in cell wall biosynthesis
LKPKTICILGSAYPFRGGISAYNERLCREFNLANDRAFIETFKLQYPGILFPGKTQYSEDPPPEDLLIHRSLNSISPFNWIKVGQRIKNLKPDLLVIGYWLPFMGPAFGTVARIAKKNKKTSVVAILHNVIPHEKRPGDRILTRYFLKPVDGFLAMSKQVLDDLNTFDQVKPRVLSPHPVFDNFGDPIDKNTARRQLGIREDVKLILFFGFIRDYKGLDLLLNAMADPILEELNIHALIAGEYYTSPTPYNNIIQENNLTSKVTMHNSFIPDSEVSTYFSAADLVVQPYKSATQSGVTQISYHFERPMVVTNVGGLPEIVADGKVGYVVERDPHEIACAINRFFTHPDPDFFKLNLTEAKKQFTWSKLRERLLKLATN